MSDSRSDSTGLSLLKKEWSPTHRSTTAHSSLASAPSLTLTHLLGCGGSLNGFPHGKIFILFPSNVFLFPWRHGELVPRFEDRALCLLGRHHKTWDMPTALFALVIFHIGYCIFFLSPTWAHDLSTLTSPSWDYRVESPCPTLLLFFFFKCDHPPLVWNL
jgi:hypothetical protein